MLFQSIKLVLLIFPGLLTLGYNELLLWSIKLTFDLKNAVKMMKNSHAMMNRRNSPFSLLTHFDKFNTSHWIRDKENPIKISTHDFSRGV